MQTPAIARQSGIYGIDHRGNYYVMAGGWQALVRGLDDGEIERARERLGVTACLARADDIIDARALGRLAADAEARP